MIKSSKYKGIIFLILSAFFFAIMGMLVHLSGDLPTFQKVFFRNFIAAIIAFIILVKNKSSLLPSKKENIKFLIARTLCGTIGMLGNFYAVDHLVLSDASILNKMSPFFVIILSVFILKEKPTFMQALFVVTAFFGCMFVVKPSFSNADLLPSLMGFMGGVAAGAAYAFVRRLTVNGENSAYIVFFFSAVSTLIALPLAIITYKPMTLSQLVILIFAGLSAAGGQLMITLAYKNAPAKEISVYDFSQIIFSASLGYFVFGQLPDVYSVIGYVIIILSAVVSFLYSNSLWVFKKKHT